MDAQRESASNNPFTVRALAFIAAGHGQRTTSRILRGNVTGDA